MLTSTNKCCVRTARKEVRRKEGRKGGRTGQRTSARSAAQMSVEIAWSMSGGTSFCDATSRMRSATSSQWSSRISYASIVKSSRIS